LLLLYETWNARQPGHPYFLLGTAHDMAMKVNHRWAVYTQARGAAGCRLPAAALVLLLLAAPARAQSQAAQQSSPPAASASAPELVDLNLFELMNVEVTSASKKAQKLSDVPSAVYVISNEDIRRSGARNLPEALRLAPGVDVGAIGANRYAVTIRGFNGRFANKLLVLIDGRTVYTPLWSGVLWESQDVVLDDVDRIEVIRGPGAAIWGANAVNGVINIITKAASETVGTLLQADAGNDHLAGVTARYGSRSDSGAYYRLYAKADRHGEMTDVTGHDAADDSRAERAGFRLDQQLGRDRFTMQGEVFALNAGDRINSGIVTPPYSVSTVVRERDQGFHLLGRWNRTLDARTSMSLQTYYDYSRIEVPILTFAKRRTFDVDLNLRQEFNSSNDLIFGLGYRNSHDDTQDEQVIRFDPQARSLDIISAFLQDELTLAPEKLKLTIGAKLEHHTYTGLHLLPNLRLLWNIDPANSAWLAASKAVRTPSRGERDALFAWEVIPPNAQAAGLASRLATRTVITGTHSVEAEKLDAFELGYRSQLAANFSLDLSTFSNHYHGGMKRTPDYAAATVVAGTPSYILLPIVLSNQLAVKTYGFELAADYRPRDWWRLQAGFSHIHFGIDRAADLDNVEGSTPRHLLSLRSSMDLGKTQFDLWLRGVAERPMYADPGRRVPGYASVDARLAWQVRRGLEWSLAGQNLLDRRHPEFFADKVTSQPLEGQRTIYLQLKASF